MVRIITNTFRSISHELTLRNNRQASFRQTPAGIVTPKAKMLAWSIFLIFFIENDTLGLFPRQFYFLYRNVRLSDIILYAIVTYSFINVKEYSDLFRSKALIIIKFIFVYLFLEFIASTIYYEQNPLEYFFRLKGMWLSLLVFPFLLLMKRNGFNYLIKLVLPVSIVSNVFYILTALTGKAFLPGVDIVTQTLPGGLKVLRVYGGTFYGDVFFLGFIFKWLTERFYKYQLPLAILFVIPHILAFGRGTWVRLALIIVVMVVWNLLRKREFKIILKQAVLFSFLGVTLIYTFITFIPQSDYMVEALSARVIQGQEDYEHNEGTYGTRMASIARLLELWRNNNVLFGIGMHPMWVIKPLTVEEDLYTWGFSDVGWASVLAAYGAVGFLMAVIFQINYFIIILKTLKRSRKYDLPLFFVLMMFSFLFFDTFLDFSTSLFRMGLFGFGTSHILIAMTVYKYEDTFKNS